MSPWQRCAPPRQQSDTPLARNRRLGRLCSGRVPVPLPKANPAPCHQRRRHAARGQRCPRLYVDAVETARDKAQRQQAAKLLLDGATVADFSKWVELALFCDAKLDVAATT